MILGKKVTTPSSKSISDFKTLVKQSGHAVSDKHSVLQDPKELVSRLKLLVGHIKSGGNSKIVKKEVTKIAGTLKKQGHLSQKEYGTLLADYGA